MIEKELRQPKQTATTTKEAPVPTAEAAPRKRSTLRDTSVLTPPKGFDHNRQAGRWVAESRLNARSDGYEARGFEAWKDEKGNVVKYGDLVWCAMSKELAEDRKQEAFELARDQIKSVKQQQDARDDELAFMLEKAGGKLGKTQFEHN